MAELSAFDRQLEFARRSGEGLDLREREDLNRQLDRLANRIQAERRDGQKRRR